MIYFIQEKRDGGLIKIGYAKSNVEARINRMQTGNPAYLDLLGVMFPGTRTDEIRLHRQFRYSRKAIWSKRRKRSAWRGEWFEPTPELMTLIKSLPPYPLQIETGWEPEVIQ